MNKIGTLINFTKDTDVFEKMKSLKAADCQCCQVNIWDMSLYTDENAKNIKAAAEEYGIEISTFWAGWSGPKEWNFTGGPVTLGIVPPEYRMQRTEEIIRGAEFAVKIGAPRVATHVGFLPENINDPQYCSIIATLRYIAKKCADLGLCFLFETGQETPVTLLRVIEELRLDNVGINMDTANLILYGKANSADAITVFGKYVMDTHIKDGFYPTSGQSLGREVKVGESLANLPEVIGRLKAVGYRGNYIIEREIRGEQQNIDILDTIKLLKNLLKEEGIC